MTKPIQTAKRADAQKTKHRNTVFLTWQEANAKAGTSRKRFATAEELAARRAVGNFWVAGDADADCAPCWSSKTNTTSKASKRMRNAVALMPTTR